MNLFSLHVPGSSWLHRIGTGWKYLLLVALTLPAALLGDWRVNLGLLALTLLLLGSTGIGITRTWPLPTGVWIVVALVLGYHLLTGSPATGAAQSALLLTAIYASRILTATTAGSELIEALIKAFGPLRRIGIDPERTGLTVAVMLRSVPALLDSFGEVRAAAAARGRERHLFALVTPVVVRAVGHAQAVGAALAARGLGDTD